jgi:uncharacterized protein YacL
MSRTLPKVPEPSGVDRRPRDLAAVSNSRFSSWRSNVWPLRAALVVVFSAIAISLSPFGLAHWSAALLGLLLSAAILFVEHRLRAFTANALLGGAFGGLLGVFAALLVSTVIASTSEPESAKAFVEYSCLLGFGYVGVVLGSEKAAYLKPGALQGLLRVPTPSSCSYGEGKLLDTSVLIDGRIADICEAHFLDGPLLVPQFVLHELQMIADSSDSLRRQRGRRGLEVLQRIQKMQTLEVSIIEDDPHTSNEVDRKLVDLALRLRVKIVTNDFNLNKVASVQGISVLNVNLLANAVRPAFLPGEGMRVFILREGKEVNQGVAYLEDGTMVVVDGARRLINKTVDILVTSVHQTPAGKMIFGRLGENSDTPPGAKHVAVGSRSSRAGLPETSLE